MGKRLVRRVFMARAPQELVALHVPTEGICFVISDLGQLCRITQVPCRRRMLVRSDNREAGRRSFATAAAKLTTNRHLAVANRGRRAGYLIAPTSGGAGVLRLARYR